MTCYHGTRFNVTMEENSKVFPEAYGGVGPCAGEVSVVQA